MTIEVYAFEGQDGEPASDYTTQDEYELARSLGATRLTADEAGDMYAVDVCPSCGADMDEPSERAMCGACGADNTDEED